MSDIVVREADRAIAAEYWDARNGEMGLPVPSAFTMNVLVGNLDDHRLVQLFARHAATARKESLEEAATIAEDHIEAGTYDWGPGLDLAAAAIRQSIERGE